MNPKISGVPAFVLAVAALLMLTPGPFADAGRALPLQDTLPKAEQILDQYVTAIGGLAALEKVNNRVIKGTLEIAGAGIKLAIAVYQARPNKAYTVLDSAATGKIETGTNGEVAWQLSAMAGPQVLEGEERVNFLHLNIFDRLAYWRTSFKKVETSGAEDVSGKPCYKVTATPAGLPPQTLYFDKESHLLLRAEMTVVNQAGTFASDTYLSDYRPVNGITLAHRTVTKLMGQERITTMESVEQNVELPADRFDLPAEIKALIKKD